MPWHASRFRKLLPFAPWIVLLLVVGAVVSQLETWRVRTSLDLLDGPLIVEPPVKSARDADIPGDSDVIGVSVGGRYRAYLVAAFFNAPQHVVNDMVGGKPVTITHCDRKSCTRVFTGLQATRPLDIRVGGWIETDSDGSMLLRVGSCLYRQDTGASVSGDAAFPYSPVEFERTTWQDWKAKHGETDIYVQSPLR